MGRTAVLATMEVSVPNHEVC